MTREGKLILLQAGDAGHLGNIFSSYAHGVSAIQRFHARVDKTPAQRGIVSN